MFQKNNKERIMAIKQIPLSWKELDIITAAERYLKGALNLPIIKFALPCFPIIKKREFAKINRIWEFSKSALHLHFESEQQQSKSTQMILLKARRIYEQEAQRILGSIFPLEHPFWKSFYQRQETRLTQPLVGIDALHFYTSCKEKISYQLLTQSLKAILLAHYETKFDNPMGKIDHFKNADRLIIDLPLEKLKVWLQFQKTTERGNYNQHQKLVFDL